jgi:hypothetical protein
VLLLLPALSLLRAAFARPRREAGLLLGAGARVLLGFAVSFSLVLLFAPAGSGRGLSPLAEDLAHLRHPLLLHTLFSSRHGLLYWSPLLWASLLGFPAFLRRDRFTALALAAPLLATTWLNAAVDEWWAGPGFSNPRFASALPLLAPSLAMALAGLQEMVKRRPLAVPTGLGFAFVLWNQLLIVQYRERKIPADDTVSFAAVTAYNAKLLGRYAGTPVAWPANLVFAWQHDLPAARYDLLVGRYLFREPDSLDGPVKIADPRALSGLLAGDWSPPVACGDAVCREVQGRARVMAPLRAPEDIDLTVHAQGDGALALRVNDREVAVFPLEAQARALHARVGEALWRRELNDVSLTVSGGRALVEQVQFERANGSRPPEPGQ